MNIPFVDLKAQYETIKEEISLGIQKVIEETAFIKGKYVAAFEEAYAKKYGVKHCMGVGNGTDAIYITLKALGIGPGDEVITVANSWISTSEVITQTGAQVVFVDIEPDYFSIDVSKIEEKITPRTKAILPVHLYGQPCAIDQVKDICERHHLYLIEDCAQAHFAQFKGQKVGTFGIAGTFSFYPGKNLGAYGDAGGIITNDDDLAQKIRMFSNHGCLKKHEHLSEGINSRMDGIQGAVLSVKLPHVDEWNQKRSNNACEYTKLLKDVTGIVTPQVRPESTHIFHLYVIRCQFRQELESYLKEKGVTTGIHYPVALPFMPAYAYLKHNEQDFPVAHQYQNEILSLPMFPELTQEQIQYVCEQIKNFCSKKLSYA